MKKLLLIISLSFLISACSVSKQEKSCHRSKEHHNAPQLTQDQISKAVEDAARPGEAHIRLNDLVGKWSTESKFYYSPDGKPEVSKGSAVHKWVLGKRYIEEKFDGSWMNKPFSGIGYLGYDNVKKKYVSSWVDSSSTGIMSNEGRFNEQTNSLELDTIITCPVTGESKKGKSVTKIISKDQHVFEMYDFDASGKEVKMMEIVYKRKK